MKKSILEELFYCRRRRIFISYRRHGDGSGYGGRLADSLLEHFGTEQCYLDVEHVEPGVDFVKSIERGIADCEVLIVVIGPDWITQEDDDGNPRLQNPNDWVRIETSKGLKRKIRVIPVLVGGAQLPSEEQLPADLKDLCRRQAQELSDSRWMHDVGKLIESIENAGVRRGPSPQLVAVRKRLKTGAALAAPILAALLLFYVIKDLKAQSPMRGQTDQPTAADTTAIAPPRPEPRTEPEADDLSKRMTSPSPAPAKDKEIYFTITERIGVNQYGFGQISELVHIDVAGNKQLMVLFVMNGKASGSVRFKLPGEGFYEYEIRSVTQFNNHKSFGKSCTHTGYGRDRIFIRDGQVFELTMDATTIGDSQYRLMLEPVGCQ